MLVQIAIPLAKAQSFPVSLPIDGGLLQLVLGMRYSKIAGYWFLSISDANNNLLLDSIPMLPGSYPAANILMPYGYLGVGSAYIINALQTHDEWPDSQGFLTGTWELWWGDTAA